MKRVILFALVVGLMGCQKKENETMKIVKSTLKDPESAEFRNVKGYCGEVNAKNSYGGYTGFDKFYVSDQIPVFVNKDELLEFNLGWVAHCESKSKLSQAEKASCAAIANFSAAVVENKLIISSKDPVKNLVKDKKDANFYLKIIDDVFDNKSIKDPNEYALKVLNDCLAGKIKAPV